MEKRVSRTMNYPPPPPPPPASTKRSSKTLVIALVIVLVIAGVGGAYYLTTLPLNNDNGPSPSSSHFPSTTPTTTSSANPTTSPAQQTASGYRLGAWANYTIKNYNATGGVTALYDLGYSVDEVIFKGIDCWLLRTERSLSMMNSNSETITTYWLDKSNLQGLHYSIQIYSNGLLISDTGDDYYENSVNDIPTAINPDIVISQESITVPAGTFNCDKTAATMIDLGNTYVTTTWGNSNIPVVGMVKQEMTSNGLLISRTELVSYGG
jgi:hypothetical protein